MKRLSGHANLIKAKKAPKRKTFKQNANENEDKRSISNNSNLSSSNGSTKHKLYKTLSSSSNPEEISPRDEYFDISPRFKPSSLKSKDKQTKRRSKPKKVNDISPRDSIDIKKKRHLSSSSSKKRRNDSEFDDHPKSSLTRDDLFKQLNEKRNPTTEKQESESIKKKKKSKNGTNDIIKEIVRGAKAKAEDFELLSVIGRGSFAKVMQVRHKVTGKIYAMKVMYKSRIIVKNQIQHTLDENSILQRIVHPFIVKLNYAFQTKDKLYLILDFVNGGELFHHLKKSGKFSEERVRFYGAEIASAIIHLHKNGIVYRDLKPENILLNRYGHIVITDFGLSKELDSASNDKLRTIAGTPEYLSPEILLGHGYSYEVDWWSFGTLLYEMLTGMPPFFSKNIRVIYNKILNAEVHFPDYVSSIARDLILRLLERDPSMRLKDEGVKLHPFFNGIDWDDLVNKKIEPPWKPAVVDENDLSQIDPDFVQEQLGFSNEKLGSLSLSSLLNENDKDIFEGFSYMGSPSMLH